MAKLRLTGGTLRSRRVSAPSGRAVRPTPARVKEALFSILASADRLAGACVLDLFAGSGALGFEALSRGAERVTFVEAHKPTAAALARTARELAVDGRCRIVAQPAERAARTLAGPYDLVFADPPYALPYPAAALGALRDRGALDPDALVVYEHSSRLGPPADPAFSLARSERYGAVALAFMTPVALPGDAG
ncbi:MAG: 16S rRNA (guanine(966)-N(2))-methyltransferase RsmD [Candidatus Velthaea sp.]